MAEKKGIRVNALAKELGVESKAILNKLRDEGLGGAAPNHMSVIALGLAESVREWFAGSGGVATAVETAPPVKAVKRARPPARKRSETVTDAAPPAASEETHAHAAPPAPVIEAEAPAPAAAAPVEEAPPAVPPPVDAEPASVAEPAAPLAPAAEADEARHEEPAPAAPAAEGEPIAPPTAPLAPAATAAPQAPAAPAPHGGARPTGSDAGRPAPRPTVTIGPTRGAGSGPAVIERKAVTVAPQLTTLQPAQIQGPRVIRVEKPDVVSAPRPRPPGGPQRSGPAGPGYTTARPTTGRGVKIYTDEEEEAAKKGAAAKGKASGSLSLRRRGLDGRRGEADAESKLKEFSEQDLEDRRIRLSAAGKYHDTLDRSMRKSGQRGSHVLAKTGAQRGEPIAIERPITVKSLSAVLGIKGTDIVRKLFLQGVHGITINSGLDDEAAETIALEYGVELLVARDATLEEQLLEEFQERQTPPENLKPRPAVVTILGHVDHGKTSLLDKIRSANVAAGEAGGITQHTAAWMVMVGEGDNKKQVTFIDTPGHQAFTSMRARGAQVTDVVVLVVAAVEGVMPQTIESINHAKAAGVPIVVALNKIDRPDANPDMVLGQLAAQGLNPIEWGGDTEVVRTSAVTAEGVPQLIEILDLQSQLMELKADPTAPARGAVIEARVDAGLGPVATVLVQDGTLKVGDVILSGPGYGRIRSLINDLGKPIHEAGPSTPVIVSGLDQLPSAGDKFYVVADFDRARAIAEERASQVRQQALAGKNQVSLHNLFDTIREGEVKTINLIIKGDVQGSVETLAKTVTDQNTDEVRVKVIHAAVGGITESDVELADASGAVIIGFHVIPDESARSMAEQRHVEIRQYSVIYEIFDDLKKALSGMLTPEIREKLHGHVEIRKVFKVSRVGNIAGCYVTDGHVQRGSKIRLTRGGIVLVEDLSIETLKRGKDDVREVKAGLECGIKLAGYDDIKEGDILEAYIRETFQRTL